MASTDVYIRLKDKLRTFFSAKPKKCRYCKDGNLYVYDRHLTHENVYIGECGNCKGTGLVD